VLVYGKQVNPRKVKFKNGRKLTGTELARFNLHVADIHTQLAALPSPLETEVALAR
jgi:hypothetical protein